MSAYWSVSGQFSFHRRAFARLLYCYFTNLIVVGFLLPIICYAQSSGPDLPARDSLYQRWLPSQDNSSTDTRKLLEKFGKQKRLPSESPEVSSPIPGLVPRDGQGLPSKLPELTPAQREKLRKIAEQYVKDGNPPFKPEDLERIPPQLLEQFKRSPELQQLAKELAEKSLSKDQDSSDDAGRAQDPFAPAPAFSNSDPQQQNAAQPNSEQKDAPNASRDSKSALPSAVKSPSQESLDRNKPSNGNNPSQPNRSSLDPQRITEGSPVSGNSSRPSLSESPNQANGSSASRPKQLNPGASKPSRSSADNPPFPTADNSQIRPGAGRREANPSPSNPSTPNNRSTRNSTDRLNEKGGQSAPAETALEKMQRTFQELGFGNVMEKIAKEAAGLEQNKNANRNATTSPTKVPSKVDSVSSQSAPSSSNARSSDDAKVASAPPRNQTSQRSEPSRSSTNRSSAEPRPSVASPSRDANSGEPSSPFELPKLEMPKFSVWWIVALVSFVALGIALWFLSKDPVVAAKVFGVKPLRPENASVALRTIRNRSDVIDAFHQLIETKFRTFESWWTSRRALQQVNKALPSLSPPMREATEIYEMARYLPADQELSEPDLERMRRAMNTCSLTGVLQ